MTDRKKQADETAAEDPAPEDAVSAGPAEDPATAEETAADDPVAALTAENADLKDRLMRAMAEVENTRRRAEKDRQEASKYGAAGLARELLPVLDNLGRALQAIAPEHRDLNDPIKNLIVGVEMTEKQFRDAFERVGIQRIEPSPGERFSYEVHQAMSEAENTGQPSGTVVTVLQPGYKLHDRLLRPAMVVVARGGAPGGESQGGESQGGDSQGGGAPPDGHERIDTTA